MTTLGNGYDCDNYNIPMKVKLIFLAATFRATLEHDS